MSRCIRILAVLCIAAVHFAATRYVGLTIAALPTEVPVPAYLAILSAIVSYPLLLAFYYISDPVHWIRNGDKLFWMVLVANCLLWGIVIVWVWVWITGQKAQKAAISPTP